MSVNCILEGNNIDTLKTLPNGFVNCCVTSPPYYGLRDYGTATWEGGNYECDHKIPKCEIDPKRKDENRSSHIFRFNRDKCHKCGAVRIDNQIGLESTPEQYIKRLVEVFREVKRILRDDGTLWVNIGDSYAGGAGRWGGANGIGDKQASNKGSCSGQIEKPKKWEHEIIKPKDLIGIPWMLAFALRADGWYLRQDIIWVKPSPMPESVKDRCTKSHEYIFLLSKSRQYYFNSNAIKEPAAYDGRKDTLMKGCPKYTNENYAKFNVQTFNTKKHERWKKDEHNNYVRNKRSVWTVATEPSGLGHFAMFPQKLILPCILAGCPENGIVLDPFMGSGTTAAVAVKNLRKYIGCEINPEYIKIAEKRILEEKGLFND